MSERADASVLAHDVQEAVHSEGWQVEHKVDWRSDVWVLTRGADRAVLRRYPPHVSLADVVWRCELLRRVGSRFNVSKSLPLTSDAPCMPSLDGRVWDLLSYLDGHTPGWSSGYDLAGHGKFMASFHRAVADIDLPPRPQPAPSLAALARARDAWRDLDEHIGVARADGFRAIARDSFGRLESLGYFELPTQLIHGDFTTFNVIATGDPPAPSGLIDFAIAGWEHPLAELGFALWQAGRTTFNSAELSPERISALVRGYSPKLDLDIGNLLAVLIRARAFQLTARLLQRGEREFDRVVERLEVVTVHEGLIADAVRSGLSS